MTVAWTAHGHGIDWRLELDRDALLPGRLVAGRVSLTAGRPVDARGLVVAFVAREHWKHEVTSTDAQGHAETRIVTERRELVREPVAVAAELHLGSGERRDWTVELPVPPLGPATLEAEVAGVDWTVEARLDIPGGLDASIDAPVRVLQPVALLRAGAVPVGPFALFPSADVAADGVRGSIAIDPVPLCCGQPFRATVALAAGGPRHLQEIRAELRVHVKATVASGLDEEIVAWAGRLPITELGGDRSIPLAGTLDARALPTIELPHGRTSATFHLILATAWAADPHLVREVAIATTLEL